MASSGIVGFGLIVVLSVSLVRSDTDGHVDETTRYQLMHQHYDKLGNEDGYVTYSEISRALGTTTEEEWKSEIELHDDGDGRLNTAEFQNWLSSFRKQEL